MWRTAYTQLGAPAALLAELAQKCTPAVLQSCAHWQARLTRVPGPGAIFFLQHGAGPHGHAGLVVRATATAFTTLEANTTPEAREVGQPWREGIWQRTRPLAFTPQASGLWLRGFLAPLTWEDGHVG